MPLTLSAGKGRSLVALALVAGALANSLALICNMSLRSPLFFDSIFTAVSGALWGPWLGMLCAVATHLFLTALHGWDLGYLFFLPCSLATGLIAGLFSGRRTKPSPSGMILCLIAVVLANSMLGASFLSRLFLNLIDKGIALALAFLALELRAKARISGEPEHVRSR